MQSFLHQTVSCESVKNGWMNRSRVCNAIYMVKLFVSFTSRLCLLRQGMQHSNCTIGSDDSTDNLAGSNGITIAGIAQKHLVLDSAVVHTIPSFIENIRDTHRHL